MNNDPQNRRPLSGVRVLELATDIAGPYAGKMLCDAGAEVVKIEPPAGDPMRSFTACGRELEPGEDSALFRFLNASKQSVVADLSTEAGRESFLARVAEFDLVLESFGPGGLEEHGLSVEALQANNPSLSVVSISSWGLEGPGARRPANAFTQEATCGSTLRRGLPGRTPIASGGQLALYATGAYAAAGAFAALVSAQRNGCGQHVDVSTGETVVTVLTTFFGLRGQWMEGPMASHAEAPSIERASDGWVGFCTYTGQQWMDFCALIGRPDLAKEEQFLHAAERFKARDMLGEAIFDWTGKRTVAEILDLATLLRVPSAPVLDARGVLECDQYQERGVFVDNPHGFRQPRPPYRISGGELRPIGRAPDLGEHTDRVSPGRKREAAVDDAQNTSRSAPAKPFEGLRIVDLTAFWAGPSTTSFFADLGADVVKIESTRRPDGMRFIGASGRQPLWEWSEVFAGVNPGKRSVTLNLDTDEGRALLMRLLETADVLAENASARVLENFGLDVETLHAHNPRLVVLRMPAWGLDGPWRDRPGFAANIEQASGVAWMTGYPDAPMMPLACDPIGGMHAAFGLMGALEIRDRTGEGQVVESTLIEPALNAAAQSIVELEAYGALLSRSANRAPQAAPQGLYRCRRARDERDPEWLAVSVEDDAQWQGLVRAIGEPAWCLDPAYATHAGRQEAHDRIDAGISTWAADRFAGDAEAALHAEGVPASAGRNAHFLFPDDQLEHRGFFQTLEHPVTGMTGYPNLPMRFSSWPEGLKTTPPPTLGQHNEEILGGELGLSSDEIRALREAKVIGETPEL